MKMPIVSLESMVQNREVICSLQPLKPSSAEEKVPMMYSPSMLSTSRYHATTWSSGRSVTKGEWTVFGLLTVEAKVDNVLIGLNQEERIVIPDFKAARDYLIRHTDIIDLVLQIGYDVSARFDSDTKLSLVVCHKPGDDEYLALYVRRASYDDSLMSMIDSIMEKYDNEFADKTGWLLVTTDFRHLG
jgi:hypothetical protein